jgi:two-component system NtrC family response regulator
MEPTKQTKTTQASGTGRAILVIDDDQFLLELLVEFLSESGYTVYTAESGEEALSLFSTKPQEIGVVITDMGLPGMSGDEVVAKIREINPSTKCVAISGFGGQEMIQKVRKGAFVTFIPKPFEREALLRLVETLIGLAK